MLSQHSGREAVGRSGKRCLELDLHPADLTEAEGSRVGGSVVPAAEESERTAKKDRCSAAPPPRTVTPRSGAPVLRDRTGRDTLARMDHRERLKGLLVQRSVRVGDFTLASGARSSYYVDARRTTMCAEGQALVGRVVVDLLRSADLAATHIGGLTMGADPVAYAVAHTSWLDGDPIDAFSVRKKAKEHGTGQRIEGGLPEDARCIVVEDSMTSGSSALVAVEAVREHGATVVAVLTLVDREEGGAARVAEAGVPLLSVFTGLELREAAGRT